MFTSVLTRNCQFFIQSTIFFLFFSFAVHAEKQRTFDICYVATVREIPNSSKKLDLWIPLPKESRHQKISDLKINSSVDHKVTTENEYGNRMVYVQMMKPKDLVQVELKYTVLRTEMNKQSGYPTDRKLLGSATKAYAFLPITDSINNEANKLVSGANGYEAQARKLYDHCLATMTYDKSAKGWGRGDFAHACNIQKGNCTDFHALFMGYCRNLGIPTVFEIGLSVPTEPVAGTTGGYHCWALFRYCKSWVPVDISEAWKDSEKREYFFGSLCENRVTLSRGRDITLSPPQNGKRLNFFVYPYAEVDGQPYENISKESFYK